MAVTTFIPEVWAASILTTLQERHVAAQSGIINRDYEGEISEFGDTVHIGRLTDPTIAAYTRNSTDLSSPEVLATTDATLLIDQANYFNFLLDDLDRAQVRSAGGLVSAASMRAANGLIAEVDEYLFGKMGGEVSATSPDNILDPEDVDSPDEAFRLFRKLRMTLNKADVPMDGRWVVVAPEFEVLLLGDNRFLDASAYGSNAPIMNGEIGRAIGFRVLVSNNLPTTTIGSTGEVSNLVIAGHPMATTYAEQINKVEALRSQKAFADIVRGLHLFGAKVVRPEALAVCDVDVTLNTSS
jgi:N4-gp56 family major capsid protein